ncbi:hypothetical protein M569_13820 [Genlisea aurea]|uniref:Uncharacterized protein n=1 Tax=Genlisea aurea TaxID=192259 RepID=S8DMS6_9LAMI|nr:hypothetical protein M569_13820 [Genlisea aurea]
MGCFLGCFGGSDDRKHRRQRIDRPDLRNQVRNDSLVVRWFLIGSRSRVQPGGSISTAEKSTVVVASSNKLALDHPNKAGAVVELPNPSPRKRVTFNTNVVTYEHVPERESVSEKEDVVKTTARPPRSESKGEIPVATTPYPPNHRYHNIRDSDDEEAEYDLDDVDDEDDFKDCDDDGEDEDDGRQEEVKVVVSGSSRLDLRRTTVLSPVENVTQWKAAAKFNEAAPRPLNDAQKENLVSNSETSESPPLVVPKKKKTAANQFRNQEISVDASLSNWLSSSPDTVSSGRTTSSSVRRGGFEDRPILGALTVEELKQISASPPPPKKSSPSSSRSTDEIPIIGTVGTYWTDSASSTSFKGIPNTTSKYREENSVKWHSTPFETRLDRALARGCS